MTDQTPEHTQLYMTAPMPCPYLPDRQERKLFTHLTGRRAVALHQLLSENGFRRSQNLIYRPACEGCNACKSVRIVADRFAPSYRYRRVMKLNRDIEGSACPPLASQEQYDLFQRYLGARHDGGGMTQMSFEDYEYMVEDTPVESSVVEYRLVADNRLVAVALTDIMPDGLSMVYSFYDPDLGHRGLGNFLILDHIGRVQMAHQRHVYLGYWVKDSPKMAYKVQFQPLEVQAGQDGWVPLNPD